MRLVPVHPEEGLTFTVTAQELVKELPTSTVSGRLHPASSKTGLHT